MPLKPMSPGGPCGRKKKSVCVQWPLRGPSSFPNPWGLANLWPLYQGNKVHNYEAGTGVQAQGCVVYVSGLNYYNNPLLLLCPFFR